MSEMFETFGQAAISALACSLVIVLGLVVLYNSIMPFISHMLQQLN